VIEITMTLTNEGAREVQKEVGAFLDFESDRMVQARKADAATRGYVILRSFLEKVNGAIAKREADERRAAAAMQRAAKPTVREVRS